MIVMPNPPTWADMILDNLDLVLISLILIVWNVIMFYVWFKSIKDNAWRKKNCKSPLFVIVFLLATLDTIFFMDTFVGRQAYEAVTGYVTLVKNWDNPIIQGQFDLDEY